MNLECLFPALAGEMSTLDRPVPSFFLAQASSDLPLFYLIRCYDPVRFVWFSI